MSSFHSCMRKNKDGSNRVIEKAKECLCPTNSPFWKKAIDISFKVSTRAQENKKELVKRALTVTAGKEVAKISENGSRQTTRTFIF